MFLFLCFYISDRGALNGFIVYKQFDYLEKAFRLQSNVDDDINRSGVLWYTIDVSKEFSTELITCKTTRLKNNSCWCCRSKFFFYFISNENSLKCLKVCKTLITLIIKFVYYSNFSQLIFFLE